MGDKDEYLPQEITHKSYVTWDRAFAGHPTELVIRQYATWAEVSLKGGGYRDEWEYICHHLPVEVMRKIVAMADALPQFPAESKP